ncbi:preprotein translocase subunit YajC [Microbacterium sp. STN6]|uniref:preprotein translocase subunit YajC n=1 Tax=Microbacterium sp. STN6 TaxID=2995588 RepID=UPI002260963F|nr:preprotein translocase subunit YajC [Microbacterium sp. STN6]MCX7521717.1 preprotein translocase subunit YajC [Microbacterium sp. STN6]
MDLLTVVMLVVLAVLIFFMFRNSRKRQKDQAALQSKIVTGADVMTNFGVFGTILSMDEDSNEVLLETTPGTVLKLHRQVIARVVEPKEPESVESPLSETATDAPSALGEPEFGERIDGDNPNSKNNE